MAWTAANTLEFERLVSVSNSHFERVKTSSLHPLLTLIKATPKPSADAVKTVIAALPAKKDAKYSAALAYLRIHYPGVDEVKVGGYTYKGFAGILNEQERRVRAQFGVMRCHEVVGLCKKAIVKVVPDNANTGASGTWPTDKQKATELFQKWFDEKRRDSSLNRVRTVLTRWPRRFETRTGRSCSTERPRTRTRTTLARTSPTRLPL